jgi:hypothetical protein
MDLRFLSNNYIHHSLFHYFEMKHKQIKYKEEQSLKIFNKRVIQTNMEI